MTDESYLSQFKKDISATGLHFFVLNTKKLVFKSIRCLLALDALTTNVWLVTIFFQGLQQSLYGQANDFF